MLTRLVIRNFKRFDSVDIELGKTVVFVGPNNSGKTTALQALALWDVGLRRWNEKRSGRTTPEKRPGVTINRRDLIAVPVPDATLLWHNLHVRDVQRVDGKQETKNVRVDVIVDGITQDKEWSCGFEFDLANDESIYCRPLRIDGGRMAVPESASGLRVAFLPPMSGLAATEDRLDPGSISVRIGEGRTADVLRNLCFQIFSSSPAKWNDLTEEIRTLFGVRLLEPEYIKERGEIRMSYENLDGSVVLDLSSSGRGLQQTMLLLAHLTINPNSVLLLDEPDAHLEILRQRQTYQLLTSFAERHHSQVIAASHSEVILNEAADRDVVVAFVGRPHRIDDRGSQVVKSLREIGFEHFYQAEQVGWVLYLEGSTDLAILRAFAAVLKHPAELVLQRLFVHYVDNQISKARNHYWGVREAKPDLVGLALFDRMDAGQDESELTVATWSRREIENYLATEATLLAFAEYSAEEMEAGPLFVSPEKERRLEAMRQAIQKYAPPAALQDQSDKWWIDTKITDDFLDRVFDEFYERLGLPNLMRKTDYHQLAKHVPVAEISSEVIEKLDLIVTVASKARPLTDGPADRR